MRSENTKPLNSATKLVLLSLISLSGVIGCGKKCNPNDTEKMFYSTDNNCSSGQASSSSASGYYIYVSSGFPTASGIGTVSRWSSTGVPIDIVHDYSTNPGFMPQAIVFQAIGGIQKMLMLSYNGTNGLVDIADTNGTGFTNYFQNNTALGAGTRRMVTTSDGGLLVTRTAAVERFNAAKARIGAPRYATSGTCTIAAGTAAVQVLLAGADYVVTSNAQATPANKLNLYNGATGACIAGAAPTGPATTMWPVDMDYDSVSGKLFVLYYPFTASTTNAQIWSFDVSSTTISNGTLLYNDIYADIAAISATPAALSSSIVFHRTDDETFVLVGTSNNSVLKFSYDGSSLTKEGSGPLIYQSALAKSISNISVLDY